MPSLIKRNYIDLLATEETASLKIKAEIKREIQGLFKKPFKYPERYCSSSSYLIWRYLYEKFPHASVKLKYINQIEPEEFERLIMLSKLHYAKSFIFSGIPGLTCLITSLVFIKSITFVIFVPLYAIGMVGTFFGMKYFLLYRYPDL